MPNMMEQHKKEWLEKEKEYWRYDREVKFFDKGYEFENEMTVWNSEWFYLFYEHFSDCKEFYCYREELVDSRHEVIEFSYAESFYQFELVKKENKLLKWDVFIKEKGDEVYHRMFRNIEDEILIQVSEKIELILSIVTNMPHYRVRLATGHYRLTDKNNVRLFELVDKMKAKG
jgi:hypothetical protein